MSNFQLPNDGQVVDTPVFKDQFDRPCKPPLGGSPIWAPGDPTIATLVPAADGLSATITPIAALGTYTYTFTDSGLSYIQTIEVVEPLATTAEPGLGPILAKP